MADKFIKHGDKYIHVSGDTELSLNTIIFGPPGTGKTFYIKKELVEKFTHKDVMISRDEFLNEKIKELAWYEVIALSILNSGKESLSVPEIARSEFIKIKAKQLNRTNRVNPTLWGDLQIHAIEESNTVSQNIHRAGYTLFDKDTDSKWKIVKDIPENIIQTEKEIKDFKEYKSEKKENYYFITFHQSYSYEEFIEGLKPESLNGEEEIGDIRYSVVSGILKNACAEALKLAGYDKSINDFCLETTDFRKKLFRENISSFALFIDEINRGNISKIFGELITLIEDDKRLGADNEIIVTLPYSKELFGIPSNLYIIGTMNTADRSIALIDTALRRRFTFTEMMPDSSLLNNKEIEGINLQEMLEMMNRRIEYLYDRDHTIGHAYFLNLNTFKDLQNVFKNKILPLLQEYFYNDWQKIRLVLNDQRKDPQYQFISEVGGGIYDTEFRKGLFGNDSGLDEYEDKKMYKINDENETDSAFNKKESYIKIYSQS